MAISPATDIVLDVLNAAPAEKAEAARARLAGLSSGAGAATGDFAAGLTSRAEAARTAVEKPSVHQQFEAMVLGSFFQTMLPDEASEVYGEGLSGDMWKSILAQHLGDSVAARGGIGIANHYLADRYKDGDQVAAMSGKSGGAAQADHDRQAALSQALVTEMTRKLNQTLTDVGTTATGVTAVRD